jgi:DNA-binding XRE family transcriptional regulator
VDYLQRFPLIYAAMTALLTQYGGGRKAKPTIRRNFGLAVRARRTRLRLSQEELAERSGLHRTYITDVENGLRNISLDNIARLALALEIPISELFVSADSTVR